MSLFVLTFYINTPIHVLINVVSLFVLAFLVKFYCHALHISFLQQYVFNGTNKYRFKNDDFMILIALKGYIFVGLTYQH